jgi:hypothetical protein
VLEALATLGIVNDRAWQDLIVPARLSFVSFARYT